VSPPRKHRFRGGRVSLGCREDSCEQRGRDRRGLMRGIVREETTKRLGRPRACLDAALSEECERASCVCLVGTHIAVDIGINDACYDAVASTLLERVCCLVHAARLADVCTRVRRLRGAPCSGRRAVRTGLRSRGTRVPRRSVQYAARPPRDRRPHPR